MLSEQQILAECIKVVNNNHLGVLTTVDPDGNPYARWMSSSMAADGLHTLYTLTARGSRKIEHIQARPSVCWMFSDEAGRNVATLYGHAEIIDAPNLVGNVWDRLMEAARVYVMTVMGNMEDVEFITIQTNVHRVEFLSPKHKIYTPKTIDFAAAS